MSLWILIGALAHTRAQMIKLLTMDRSMSLADAKAQTSEVVSLVDPAFTSDLPPARSNLPLTWPAAMQRTRYTVVVA